MGEKMIKVMFVCLGNICRSPMAEFVFKDIIKKEKLEDKIEVYSSGTSSEENGNPVHYGTREKLKQFNISCSGKYSTLLKKSDYDKYDFFIGMDKSNIIRMKQIFGHDDNNKVSLLLSYQNLDKDIRDPWYTGNFDETYDDILYGIKGFLKYLKNSSLI